jgi:two-component system, cell cycle response regulator
MALRVLLADESPTIKKVMQISLQDFNIELKAVQLGIDVLQVAEAFQPEIIFCDVLLQKKSGYDVSMELKNNPKTKNIPIVLMWSGFMELDEEKFRECRADGHIEKPFDSHALRDIVKNLVHSTKEQTMSEFLEFPEVTAIRNQKQEIATKKQEELEKRLNESQRMTIPERPPLDLPPEPSIVESHRQQQESPTNNWSMDSFDDITHFSNQDKDLDSFQQKPLQALESPFPEAPPELEQDQSPVIPTRDNRPVISPQKPLISKIPPMTNEFTKHQRMEKANPGPVGLEMPDTGVEMPPEEDVSHSELLANVSMHPSDLDKFNIKGPPRLKRELPLDPVAASPAGLKIDVPTVQLTQEQLEFIIRSQSKEIIERIVWKLIPEIADKLIKEEIKRLTDETKL